jgi:hypothetical protein
MDLTDEEKEALKGVLERLLARPLTGPPLTIRERRTLRKVQEYVETTARQTKEETTRLATAE